MVRRFSLLLLLLSYISSQTTGWTGVVLDANHVGLSYPVITHLRSNSWVIGDEKGRFTLPGRFLPGDTCSVQRYGYQTRRIALPPAPSLAIILNPDLIGLPEVSILGVAAKNESGMTAYVDRQESGLVSGNLKIQFSRLPGVTIRTYGGPGSPGLISVDGGTSNHTAVQLNGYSLTNQQTGVTDLSQLPSPMTRQASLTPNPGLNQQPGTSDGLVELNPWGNPELELGAGQFGHLAGHWSSRYQTGKFQIRALVGTVNEDGDFNTSWRGRTRIRTNNDFSQTYGAFQVDWLDTPQSITRMFVLSTAQTRGNPGQVWAPSEARRDDNFTLAGLTRIYLLPDRERRFTASVKYSRDHYRDSLYSLNSSHRLLAGTLQGLFRFRPVPSLEWTNLAGVEIDTMHSSVAGNYRRISIDFGQSFSWKIQPGLVLNVSGKYEYYDIPDHAYSVSGYLAWSAIPGEILTFGLAGSRSLRIPTLNELYWKPGGNPNLLPETMSVQRLYLNSRLGPDFSLTLEAYLHYAGDLIRWVPVTTYWQPVNVERSRRTGFKGKLDWRGPGGLAGFLSFNRTRSEYLVPGDHFGKPLTYSPELLATNVLTWKGPGETTLQLQSQYTASIISIYSWPDDVILPAVTLHSIQIGKDWDLFHQSVTTNLSCDNLANTHYEMTRGYPEMGRSIRFTLTIREKND